jgi:DNA invertase Pin-like site-specific DNA recombinase
MPVAIYVRSSGSDPAATAPQLHTLRAFVTARGWQATEYVDDGVPAAKSRRPALDAMLAAARQHEILCTGLDRLTRSSRALAALLGELATLDVEVIVRV